MCACLKGHHYSWLVYVSSELLDSKVETHSEIEKDFYGGRSLRVFNDMIPSTLKGCNNGHDSIIANFDTSIAFTAESEVCACFNPASAAICRNIVYLDVVEVVVALDPCVSTE